MVSLIVGCAFEEGKEVGMGIISDQFSCDDGFPVVIVAMTTRCAAVE